MTSRSQEEETAMFIECLDAMAREPASAVGEPVLTIDELARQFSVSTKTVSRWRRLGLVSRRFLFDGRARVGFLQSTVNRFLAENKERIHRAAQFRRLTDEGRCQIVERARCLIQAGVSPGKLMNRIAKETRRSPETIRYTLKRFDLEHPDMAVLTFDPGPLAAEAKWEIGRQHRCGESAQALAQRFHQPLTRISRIINAVRAAEIMELPLDHIDNEQFASLDSRKGKAEMCGPLPESDLPMRKPRVPRGIPSYLADLYEVPLLTREQEASLFRRMNYLKYKANTLRGELDPNHPKRSLMDRIEKLYKDSVAAKNQIIRANLRLVVSIAKRYVGQAEDFFELVSDGNLSLIRAVEKFDVSRGNKFSTYATWAITRNFSRTIPGELRHRDRFRSSNSEMLSTVADTRADHCKQEAAQFQRVAQVQGILRRLDERERQIVASRFGLAPERRPLTLKEIGAAIGVTKERVRQLQTRAMGKLRTAAEEDRIEFDMADAGPAGSPPPHRDSNSWGGILGGGL
jgi:RNA polymerase primary sigma factor